MLKGITINDIHFGIKESSRLFSELHQVTDFLEENEDIKLVVIAGDYFQCKLSLTDLSAGYALEFFIKLREIVKKRKGILRLIQGTRGHDLNQPYNMFHVFENDPDFDFKIIEMVSEEEIDGCKILYLPEEYPQDADEYYREYREGKEYSMIFGHGTWDFVAHESQIKQGNRTDVLSNPVFIWKEWKDTVPNGFISFGHIHGRNTFGKKIFYSGSFTSWNFGERSTKGFTYFEYDQENKTYEVKYIDNTEAPKFTVMSVSDLEIEDLNNVDVQLLKEIIERSLGETDFLRINLSGLPEATFKIIKEHFSGNDSLKLEYQKKSFINLKESSEKENEEFDKYHYITKKQLPLDKTIQRFCKEEYGIDLTTEVISEILKEEKE